MVQCILRLNFYNIRERAHHPDKPRAEYAIKSLYHFNLSALIIDSQNNSKRRPRRNNIKHTKKLFGKMNSIHIDNIFVVGGVDVGLG